MKTGYSEGKEYMSRMKHKAKKKWNESMCPRCGGSGKAYGLFSEKEYVCEMCNGNGKAKPQPKPKSECAEPYVRVTYPYDMSNPKPEEVKVCHVCATPLVLIRGRYPKDDKRWVCADCLQSRMEQIHDLSSRDYGITSCVGGK
jgi:protein-arginine kinase activator protein McsA